MAAYWAFRARFRPRTVRLLLIAESPPRSFGLESLRHFYHPAAPPPDTLFRATAPVLVGEDATPRPESRTTAKERALARLAKAGFFLLDSAQCPVNHLASPAIRGEVARRCADVVLRDWLARLCFAPEARICLVVRSSVPRSVLPVLQELGLDDRVVFPGGLPFPGRWPGHREAFQRGLAEAARQAGWEEARLSEAVWP